MKRLIGLFAVLALLLGGCVFITIPGPGPLKEKVVGGEGDAKIVLIDISGIITDNEEMALGLSTAPRLTARIKEELDLAMADPGVKGIILRINTPGGSVTTCDIIAHELRNFKKNKKTPIVAELMDVAASGGYYIAASADTVIAHPTTVTGSIGVIAYNVEASGLMEKIGIANQTIKSGEKKDIGSPLRPMTEDERRVLQSVIDSMYERFLDVIVEGRQGRGVTKEGLRKVADGRVYTAGQAMELGLVDSIGYLDDAVDAAKKAANVKEARIVTYAAGREYRNNIYSGLASVQPPSQINLINIDAGLSKRFGLSFMYIWMP